MSDEAASRPGSAVDLSRRMDRLEANHETLAKEVGALTATVGRVEINQQHAEELNRLRFSSLDLSVGNLTSELKGFMQRIEGMISGEIDTNQAREGRELVADYKRWRDDVDADRTRISTIGRLAVILIGGNALALLAALYAVVHG